LQTALKDNVPIEGIRNLYSDLQQAAHSLSLAAYEQTASIAEGAAGTSGGYQGNTQQPGGDDVVDAEFEEK